MTIHALNREFYEDLNLDGRKYRRVSVNLKVAIPGKNHTYPAQAINISEGGLLICGYQGPELSMDDEIQLHIDGILSDNKASKVDTYTMKIIRLEGKEIGLKFC